MSDIASLGVKVESNLKTLNKDMEKTISLSEKVTDATEKMKTQMAGVSSTTKNVITEEVKRQRSIDNLIKSLTMQEIRLKEGKIGLDNYKASLLGATDAEKKQIAALNTSIKAMQDANTAAKSHDSVLGSLISRLSALGAAYFGVQAIKAFASSLIDTAKIMDSYKYSLLAVSENSTQAAETYEYLRKEADRLGLSLTTQEKAFTGFAAAAKQSGLRVEETRSIYSGLMEAMTAIHRSPEEASQALKAFQDMLSKGTIQAEELKKQLGNSLPGAMSYMADATGKTTKDLMKMMEQGILPANEGIRLLSDYLSNKFQTAAESASNGIQGSINKMDNAWYELKKAIVDAMGDNTTGIIRDATETIKKFTEQLQSEQGKQAIKDLADKIKDATNGALALVSALAEILKYAGLKSVSGTFIDGLKQSEQGYLDTQSFVNAGFMERQKMLEDSKKKQADHTKEVISDLSKEENQWGSLFVETIKSTGGIEKGIKRVSDAQVELNKKQFGEKTALSDQADAIQKIIDKIEKKSVAAGMSSEQSLIAQLKEAGASKDVIAAQQKIVDGIEAKDKAYKDSLKTQKEVESDEKKRLKFIDNYVAKLEQEADTYKKGKEYTADYVLSQKDATEAQKQRAVAAGALIDAAKNEEYWEKKRVQQLEDFDKLMKRVYPSFEGLEKERQEAIELTAKIYADKLIPVLGNTIAMFKILDERENKLSAINSYFDSEELKKFKSGLSEVETAINSIQTTSFGNELADGINNAVVSMRSLNNYLEKQTDIQDELNKKREDAKELTNEKDRKKALKEIDDLEHKNITNQLSGYRQLFGTTSQLFKENSREREVMHNIEMAFAAAEIAMNLEKTISAAYLAIAESGTLPPPASFAAIAAMTSLMAGIVAAAGGSLSGGGSASAPSVSASSTQGTGTVMGNPSEKSQSANNALEFMKDIEAKQYNELRDINKGVVDLNNNITNLVTSIVRTGAGNMAVQAGSSGGVSNAQNIGTGLGITGAAGAAGAAYFGAMTGFAAISTTLGAMLSASIPGAILSYNALIQTMKKAQEETNGLAAAINMSLAIDTAVFGNASDWLTEQIGNVTGALIGGSKKTSILAQGLEVSTAKIGDLLEGAGLDIQKFADIKIKKSGGLFGSDKTYLKTITEALEPDEESIKIMFTNVFKNVGETMVAISKELNMGDDKLKEIYSHVFDIGKIDLKGMDTDQINEAISSVINTASDQAVTALFGELIGKYVQVGEALLETAIRVVSERAVVLDILEMTGQGFKDSDIPAYSLEVTQSLINVAGGIKELQDASATYYDKFFTDSEKQIRLQGQLSETMTSMGQSMPTTREGLRKIVESLDLTTEAGQRGYVTLLGLSESFDSVFSKIEADNEKKLELELQIMNLTGKGAEALAIQRQKEIDSLSEANKPLQERIYALQDEAEANKEATDLLKKQSDERIAALKAEAAEREAIEKKKFDLEIQILKLTGKETEATALLRKKELDALDASLRPLQEAIYVLEDLAAVPLDKLKLKVEELKASIDETISESFEKFSFNQEQVSKAGGLNVVLDIKDTDFTSKLSSFTGALSLATEGLASLWSEIGKAAATINVSDFFEGFIEEQSVKDPFEEINKFVSSVTKRVDALKDVTDVIVSASTDASYVTAKMYDDLYYQRTQLQVQIKTASEDQKKALQESIDAITKTFTDMEIMRGQRDASPDALKFQETMKTQESIEKALLIFQETTIKKIGEGIADSLDKDLPSTISESLKKSGLFDTVAATLAGVTEGNVSGFESAFAGLISLLTSGKITTDEFNESFEFAKDLFDGLAETTIIIAEDLNKKFDLEMQILRLTGKETEAIKLEREKELAALGDTLKPLQEKIWLLEDEKIATEKLKEISEQKGSLELQIAKLTLSETEYLALTRQKELLLIDDSNKSLQERIWALEDAAIAADIAAKVEEDRINKLKEIAEQKGSLELRLSELTLSSMEYTSLVRQKELLAIDDSNKSLQERIWALEDAAIAAEIAAKAEEDRINKAKDVAEKKASLEIQILNLTGRSAEALTAQRAIELLAIDDSNKSLQERIWALEDEALAADKIKEIMEEKSSLEIRLLEAQGKESEVLAITRAKERLALDETNRALYDSIILLEDKNKAEAELKEIQDKADEDKKILLEKNLSESEEMLKKSIDKQISFYQTMADEANRIFEEAKGLLDRSFAAEQESITKKHESLIAGLTTRLEEAQTAASDLESVFNSLSDARKSMEGDSVGLTYKAVQKQLIDAISLAKSGDMSGAKGLVPNLGILTSQGAEKYGSQEEFKRDFFKTYNSLSELEKLTDTQLTEQQQIVKNLETQIEITNVNHALNMEILQDQYDAVLGVDKSVISFADAVIRYQRAQYDSNGANTLLKAQTEILNNQLNTLLGIDTNIISVTEAINSFIAAQTAVDNQTTETSVPAFASGGSHYGGLRLVGENGPEMEYTPPSHITSNSDLKSIMSNEDVVAELKAMRAELARANFELVKNSDDSKKTLREWKEIGIITRSA